MTKGPRELVCDPVIARFLRSNPINTVCGRFNGIMLISRQHPAVRWRWPVIPLDFVDPNDRKKSLPHA